MSAERSEISNGDVVHILVNLRARIGSGSIPRIVFGGVSERPNHPGYDRWASWGILGGSGSGFRPINILAKNVTNSAVRHEVHFNRFDTAISAIY